MVIFESWCNHDGSDIAGGVIVGVVEVVVGSMVVEEFGGAFVDKFVLG